MTKKGQGIAFTLPEQSAREDKDTQQPRTGLGMLSRVIGGAQVDGEAVSRLTAEVAELKRQATEQWLDPAEIAFSRWTDRHPDAFTNQAFQELKNDIQSAGGNVQPIKVRARPESASADGPRFELIYGSRRTRACQMLGLKVRAVVVLAMDDRSLYIEMQRENRGRENLSAWEQGASYLRALSEGLFPSQRAMAEQIGVDHSNVAKALKIAQLPQEIVCAFRSPIDIQFRWANALEMAYRANQAAMLATAHQFAATSPKPPAAAIFRALTAVLSTGKTPAAATSQEFSLAGGKSGLIRKAEGGFVTVELPDEVLPQTHWTEFGSLLKRLLEELKSAP